MCEYGLCLGANMCANLFEFGFRFVTLDTVRHDTVRIYNDIV